MSVSSQIALADDVEVAVGDDWSRSFRFLNGTTGLHIADETFTAEVLSSTEETLLTLTQAVAAHADDAEGVQSVLTLSTLDIALTPSPLHRWVLRTSTLGDRGLVGGAFIVRPVSAARRAATSTTGPTVNLGGGVTLTLNVGAIGASGTGGSVYLTDGANFATAAMRNTQWGVTADGNPYYDDSGVAAADRAFLQFNPETGAPVLIRIGA